jgi:hypothetical protein
VLRLPSLNALEGELKRVPFQRLLGRRPQPDHKAFSADTVARVLDSLAHDQLRQLLHGLVDKAERNKAFRDGPAGARRCVALDGWEPFASYHRRCDHCLTRQVRTALGERTQYYHAFVFAWLLSEDLEVVLDFEPLRPADLRRRDGRPAATQEGELTAALRLLDRLHADYGSFLDLFVLDSLYPNGPMMTRLTEYGYGAVITVKNEATEPLQDALAIMAHQPPCQLWNDPDRKEQVELWDVDELETLDTFRGKVRVVRAEVASTRTRRTHTWCAAVIGERARRLPARTIHRLQRLRWHQENTAFHQWGQLWNLGHVFRHTPGAVLAVLCLWLLGFNLVQLFAFRRLRRPRQPQDPCDTTRNLVAAIAQAVCALRAVVPWVALLDSS